MKKIVLLSTGGTIASKKNPETGLHTAGMLTGEELINLCQLPESIDLEVISVFQVPSNQMSFNKFMKLKQKIDEVFADETVDGIVITHGTDTLEETAYFVDLTIADKRPVVLTGSQRVPDAIGSDAFTNLRQAILVASDEKSDDFGALVLFNERIYSARHVKKMHASNVDGFSSPGFGYLGIIDLDRVYYYQKPIHRETYTLNGDLPRVDIIKWYAGADGKLIKSAYEIGAQGIIIEGAGRGHVSPETVADIKYVIDKGVPVVVTTSSQEGEVNTVYDFPGSVYDLINHGAITGKDYDSKKARVKLAVLLAASIKNIQSKF